MRKLISAFLLFTMFVMWPFSCEAQVNGSLDGPDSCDTIFIENPKAEAELARVMADVARLNNDIIQLSKDVEDQKEANTALLEMNRSLNTTVEEKTSEIEDLRAQLAQKADTVFVDKVVEVIPEPVTDTVVVTHCSDSTKNTVWLHHGGISGYPHDISFATKELSLIRVHFKDSLTDEIKVQKSYKLKRTKDFENARTVYEFIE